MLDCLNFPFLQLMTPNHDFDPPEIGKYPEIALILALTPTRE